MVSEPLRRHGRLGRLARCTQGYGGLPLTLLMAMVTVYVTVAVGHDLCFRKWEEAMRGEGGRPPERVALLVQCWPPERVALMVLSWEAQSSGSIECVLMCRGGLRMLLRSCQRIGIMKRGKGERRRRSMVLRALLQIGCVEMNPGPTPSSTEAMQKRPLVSVWTVFNVDILFKNARVGKDESIGARVERLLAMCRPDSVAASRLVDLYTEIQREHARKKAENENNRDAGLDQAKVIN